MGERCATNHSKCVTMSNKFRKHVGDKLKKTTWQQIEKHLGNKYIYILSTNTDNNKLLPSPGVTSSLLSRAR